MVSAKALSMKLFWMALLMPQIGWSQCIGNIEFDALSVDVEIVADQASRAQGLMHREVLDEGTGMLFAYPEDGDRAFWMKNTLIPLDIIYYTEDGAFDSVQENAIPHDRTPLPGFGAFVLELNAGEFSQHEDSLEQIEAIGEGFGPQAGLVE